MTHRLITIPISHYCEKARWALEWARIPYVEERHLQVFHYWATYRAAKTASVPVLVTPDRVLTDSTDILKFCDSNRKLFPSREAEELENEFDETIGVDARLWTYSYILGETELIHRYSALHGLPKLHVWLLPYLLPLVRRQIEEAIELKPTSRKEAHERIDLSFDRVAERLGRREYLVGNAFSAADLTFAALSAAILFPESYGVKLPSTAELPEEMRKQVEKWRAHPAGKYALRIYREHRSKPD